MTSAVPRPTPRERARAELMRDLLAAARARLVAEGAGALSLRAVARDLGLASSAVYRYVPSRDALLTLLVAESYDAVGQVCEDAAAASRAAGHAPARRWLEVARAVRAWALADRHAYELIYGTPLPGYAAPPDTVAPALRVWAVLVDVVVDAAADGSLRPGGPDFDPDGVVTAAVHAFGAERGAWAELDDVQRRRAAVRSLTLFCSMLGAVSAELFGHLRGVHQDAGRTFDVTVATAAAGVGLHVDLAAAWAEAATTG
ncbi:TetR family transcriptional regulator [Cellulomonas sp. JZ18]|uniref:TetR-like C-terminal domain-containing protein n=1 Tax=Cellulomonas sp. JZ18 TaxID=2654191 RepID=UPI0012D3B8AD|nr:TetR-like C-terminal domain-containing protein [Cellulomonas sp. JZ18]QGQ18745.1 TetR family transcriptional regulator [Cellulomonas sp. JZ18]